MKPNYISLQIINIVFAFVPTVDLGLYFGRPLAHFWYPFDSLWLICNPLWLAFGLLLIQRELIIVTENEKKNLVWGDTG